jgi:hypothetical protein
MMIEEFIKHPRIQQLSNIDQIIKDLKQKFEPAKVIRLIYSKSLIEDFCHIFQIPYVDRTVGRTNESPKSWAIELMRQVNCFRINEKERNIWRSVIQEFSLSNHSVMRDSLNKINQNEKKLNQRLLNSIVCNHCKWYNLEKTKIEEFKNFIILKKYI